MRLVRISSSSSTTATTSARSHRSANKRAPDCILGWRKEGERERRNLLTEADHELKTESVAVNIDSGTVGTAVWRTEMAESLKKHTQKVNTLNSKPPMTWVTTRRRVRESDPYLSKDDDDDEACLATSSTLAKLVQRDVGALPAEARNVAAEAYGKSETSASRARIRRGVSIVI